MATKINMNHEIAVFGCGCFWCVEAIFEDIVGVTDVVSGYAGGTKETANYKDICSKETDHIEVAKIVYNPEEISYAQLLEVFWTTHDPTTLNQQGNDRGPQYRSAIFFTSQAQKDLAIHSVKAVGEKLWENPITTEIVPLEEFFDAEDYHQNYYKNNQNEGYCSVVINPKVSKFRKKFAHLLKENQQEEILNILSEGNYNDLDKFSYNVLINKGTERAFTGKYDKNTADGIYLCKQCNQPLFDSKDKFDSRSGWPSFDDMIGEGVKEIKDADGRRIEIVCGNCGGHLGHVFKGEGMTSKSTRHCVNSASLNFIKR